MTAADRFRKLREAGQNRFMARYAMPRGLRPSFAYLARTDVQMASRYPKPRLP